MKWYSILWILIWIIGGTYGLIYVIDNPPLLPNIDNNILNLTGFTQEKLSEKKIFNREIDGFEFTITAKYR